MIEFCIVCYNFQKRLVCQLSSIIQQINCPELIINLAYVNNDSTPKIEEIIKVFSNLGLTFKTIVYNSVEDLKFRNRARNKQIEISTEEWLFFSDCDLIYHPEWFRLMYDSLDKNRCGIFSSSKIKYIDPTNLLDQYWPIDDIYQECCKLPVIGQRQRVTACGGCSIINRDYLMRTDGIYASERCLKHDGPLTVKTKCYSDVRFKNVYKGSIHIDLPYQFHLNHSKTPTEQR